MNKFAKAVILSVWLIILAILFAAIWLGTPSLWFINLPGPVWVFLTEALGATCCESAANVEVGVGLLFGFIFALAFSGLVFFVSRYIKRLTKSPGGR